jgi:hypothetical protein
MRRMLDVIMFISFLLCSMAANAQNFDLKKEIISKDKVPYAKFAGKVGLSKTNAVISSLNGDSLITVKNWRYDTDNPQFSHLFGYKIEFKTTGKSLIKLINVSLISKEHLIDFVLQDRDFNTTKRDNEFKKDLIVNNTLDEAVVDEYIAKYNKESVIKEADEYQARENEIIKGIYPVERDKTKPVKVEEVVGGYYVYQDGQHLVSITKKSETTPMGITWTYVFSKQLQQPFTIGDKQISRITIATATFDSFPKLYINVKGKEQSVESKMPSEAQNELTTILINGGYL